MVGGGCLWSLVAYCLWFGRETKRKQTLPFWGSPKTDNPIYQSPVQVPCKLLLVVYRHPHLQTDREMP